MLNWIREKFGTVVIGGIIGFIGFVFVFYGVFNPRSTRGLHDGAVAGTVNGEVISIAEFNREYGQRIEYAKGLFGDKLSEEQLRAFHFKSMVFQDLVRRKLMTQESYRSGVLASDEEVMEKIREMPAFQKDGKFDWVTYKQLLEANQFTPGSFERRMREDLSLQRWGDFFRNRAMVSDGEVRRRFLASEDKRNIKYVLLTTETGKKRISLDAKDVEKYLQDPAKLNLVKAQYESKKKTEFNGKGFDQVKDQIARSLLSSEKIDEVRKENDRLADQVAAIMTAEAGSDTKVNALLKTYGVEVKKTGLVPGQSPYLPGIGEAKAVVADAFAKKSPIDPSQGGRSKKYALGSNHLVAIVVEVRKPDLSKMESERENLTRQLVAQKEKDLFEHWLKRISAQAKIDPNPAVVGEDADGAQD